MALAAAVPAATSARTSCAVVGAGPAGMILSWLLARRGVDVTLLEFHRDFDRDFRGDALSPAVLEMLAEMDLADGVLSLRHARIEKLAVDSPKGPVTVSDFTRLPGRFRFMTVLPQARLLEHVAERARALPSFHLLLEANVQGLIEEDGVVRGLRWRRGDTWHELRADLVVGADGRHSRVRTLGGFQAEQNAPPMDVLWFRLPRSANDPASANLSVHFGRGFYLALIDCFDHWKISYVIPKGGYEALRDRGIDAFRATVAQAVPMFADRTDTIGTFKDINVLSVGSALVKTWHRPGLLLIGDAAHVMSSVGGVGIQCAIQDAVVAANVLRGPLAAGTLTPQHLAEFQRRRQWPIKLTQAMQRLAQRQVIARALDPDKPFAVPLPLRIPVVRDLAARFTAYGLWPVHVEA